MRFISSTDLDGQAFDDVKGTVACRKMYHCSEPYFICFLGASDGWIWRSDDEKVTLFSTCAEIGAENELN